MTGKKKSTVKSPHVVTVKKILRKHRLHSVCESAHCPNIGDCFKKRTATFLILGNSCTRNCRFCDIPHDSAPPLPDSREPQRLADAAAELELRYVVITSVTRDDLPRGGAPHFAAVVNELRARNEHVRTEVLTPDFNGDSKALDIVARSRPDLFNHNVETVPRLYSTVRSQADYSRSLEVVGAMKQRGLVTKSGIMTGLGETMDELRAVMDDLRTVGCDILTVGQYFRPSRAHLPVTHDYTEEEFATLREYAVDVGFSDVFAGRFVRSSFNASELYETHNAAREERS